jgi:cell division protein FtsB
VSASAQGSRRYRARVAPRGSRRGGLSRIKWDKIGRVALVMVLAAVLASYINPVVSLVDTWRDSRAAEQQLTELKVENQRLERRAKELKTPAAAVREARKLGFVAEGEQAYVIKGLGR